jgi:hypothetical protein
MAPKSRPTTVCPHHLELKNEARHPPVAVEREDPGLFLVRLVVVGDILRFKGSGRVMACRSSRFV